MSELLRAQLLVTTPGNSFAEVCRGYRRCGCSAFVCARETLAWCGKVGMGLDSTETSATVVAGS